MSMSSDMKEETYTKALKLGVFFCEAIRNIGQLNLGIQIVELNSGRAI